MRRQAYFLIFTISGFAGLIYESVWSHYLKLFLGHAAYAQTLVLVIFMGGMALGAWLAARYSRRIRSPLLGYAVVELLIGALALGFHPLFVATTDFIYEQALPSLESTLWIGGLKWAVGSLLILPQSVLLGATFPLMSAGILRAFPSLPGRSLSFLYFTNSLGAAAGVIASGFFLIRQAGLPGTILVAGVLNILLALVVWLMARSTEDAAERDGAAPIPSGTARPGQVGAGFANLMIAVALLTGAASFMYEIGWIRMLSLVLGSTTHSFELMLSAFILGLALGSFWIRRKIDSFQRPLMALGWIQVLMGLAALGTLLSYGQSFEFMALLLSALQSNEQGYLFFNLFSHAICLGVMLPVTFLAGMTLPMITRVLLGTERGEASIGQVYAANTVGAILGVLFAVHLVMPVLGLKQVIVIGGFLDIGLGVYLLARDGRMGSRRMAVACAACVFAAVAIALLARLDPVKMASGVYRDGIARKDVDVLFHRDGKTASVDVVRARPSGMLIISTNGKPDASISFGDEITRDEPVQILSAVLPMMLMPQAREVAVIGIGSGRTSHTFLMAPDIRSVDTIEIEPAMVAGARLFGESVANTFNDPRSRIVIEDARTYFQLRKKRYDIIMSEPSNPWVSGVSSLFTEEFYRRIRGHLNDEGLFVQWLQLYAIDMQLVSSVVRALSPHFADYAIYAADNQNILIVARRNGTVPPLSGAIFDIPALQPLLRLVQIHHLDDMRLRHIGGKRFLDGFFASYQANPNSDYFPILDQNAGRALFLRANAIALTQLATLDPVWNPAHNDRQPVSRSYFSPADSRAQAAVVAQYIDWQRTGHHPPAQSMGADLLALIMDIRALHHQCEPRMLETVWLGKFVSFTESTVFHLSPSQAAIITGDLKSTRCFDRAPEVVRNWINLYEGIGLQDYARAGRAADAILSSGEVESSHRDTLLTLAMVARIKLGQTQSVPELYRAHAQTVTLSPRLRFLLAYAGAQRQ